MRYRHFFKFRFVISNANMPYLSTRIPDARRNVAGDFPSEHSKRSQIKLEPLEQRRFRSTESRPISTSNYLTESVERHRDMEASRLKEYLKAKESDANQPWNKPGWPGPKKNDENNRELETLKQKIETLQRVSLKHVPYLCLSVLVLHVFCIVVSL
ncbi:hypothetical protein B9Z55_008383 [Caenorhabditis nigoni]|uniref:Uncharacterized protein n=2 Tax=Caenorhabditis nigoni TaxID=1611254 RepID=A0A2G5UMK4_9PELO|nr:hypothetical protein B9Z55_008383 [Caenorhabditis nigoni]